MRQNHYSYCLAQLKCQLQARIVRGTNQSRPGSLLGARACGQESVWHSENGPAPFAVARHSSVGVSAVADAFCSVCGTGRQGRGSAAPSSGIC